MQYNLVSANGQGISPAAGKVTVGLALWWPCITAREMSTPPMLFCAVWPIYLLPSYKNDWADHVLFGVWTPVGH